jgi:L-ribulose-5-phosphate 4-epimerase
MIYGQMREEVFHYAIQMVHDGLAYGSQGNISLFDRRAGIVALTPSAIPYHAMKPEDICLVDDGGRIISAKWKPTSEMALHLIYYLHRPDINAVIHTHAPYATVFGVINEPIPMILTEAAACIGAEIPIAAYQRPGTMELARSAIEIMGQGIAVVLANHGLVVVGETLARAYESTQAVESSARLTIMARSMNKTPAPMDSKEVSEMRRLYQQSYHPQPS